MKLAHLFLPGETNNHRAKILHSQSLFLLAVFFLIYQLSFRYLTFSYPNILGYAANISVNEAVRLTNEKRVESGLSPLEISPVLTAAAKEKGLHMLEHDYWAHIAPDGTEPWKFFTEAGYKYRYAGENLARDFSDAPSAVTAWMASPSHKENMLSNKYREIGIAVVEGDLDGVETTIIVQFFGTSVTDKLPSSVAQAQTSAVSSPQPKPTIAPTIGVSENTPEVLISPFNVNKGVSLGVVGLLLGIMVVDSSIVTKRRIPRLGGRIFAHMAFLGMIVALILIAKAGQIL